MQLPEDLLPDRRFGIDENELESAPFEPWLTFLAMTHFRFLFHTFVTVPPFPAPRSCTMSKSSFLTKSSPFLSFVRLGLELFLDRLELELSLVARCVGVVGAVGDDDSGESREDDDLDDSCSRSMSWRRRSVSEIQGTPFLPVAGDPSVGGRGAGRMDREMLRPWGFFRDTEDVLREGKELDGVVQPLSSREGMEVGIARERAVLGSSGGAMACYMPR